MPTKLPGSFAQSMPAVMHSLGAIMIFVGLGAQANPDLASSLGWPTGLAGVLVTAGGWWTNEQVKNKFKLAHTEAELLPAKPPEGVDEMSHLITYGLGLASTKGNEALTTALTEALKVHTSARFKAPEAPVAPLSK